MGKTTYLSTRLGKKKKPKKVQEAKASRSAVKKYHAEVVKEAIWI